jgi:hypothetical protein
MNRIALAGMALVLAAGSAMAQTVNDYTPTEQARAERAVRAAGFVPRGVSMAQDGYLFLRAEKDGKLYVITVSPRGETWPSTPVDLPLAARGS